MTAANVTQVMSFSQGSGQESNVKATGTDEFSKIFAKSANADTAQKDVKTTKPEETSQSKEVKPDDKEIEGKTTDSVKTEKETDVEKTTEETKAEDTTTREPVTDNTTKVEKTTEEEISTEDIETIASVLVTQAQEIMEAIQEVLGVTKEQLMETMDSLDMTMTDLLNADNIPKIAVALTEGADEFSLVTDENLFANVKELVSDVKEALDQIGEALNMQSKDVEQMLGQLEETVPQQVMTNINQTQEEEPVLMVETDAEQVVTESESKQTNHTEEQSKDSGKESNKDNGNSFQFAQSGMEQLKAAVNKLTQTATTTYSADPEAIMKQITETLKLTMKEDATQMEMQLHPASLGSVKVQVAAKEGVITATFTTENEAVKSVIESQLITLRENMNEQGIKVEAVEVTVASHAFERNLSDEGNGNNGNEQMPGKKKGIRRIDLSALQGESEDELEEEDKIVADMMKQNGNTVDYTA